MATAYHMEALRKQRVLDRALEAREKMEKGALERQSRHHHHHHHHKRARPASAQAVSDVQAKKNRSRSATPQASLPSSRVSATSQTNDGDILLAAEELPAVTPTPTPPSQLEYSRPGSHLSTDMLDQELMGPNSQGPSREMSAMSGHTTSMTNHTPAKTPTKSPTPSESSAPPKSHLSSRNSMPKSAVSSRSQSRACSSHMSCCSHMTCTTCCSCATASCSECARLGTYSRRSGSQRSGSHTTTCSEAERRAEEVRRDLTKQELVLRDSNLVLGPVSVEQEVQIRKMQQQ